MNFARLKEIETELNCYISADIFRHTITITVETKDYRFSYILNEKLELIGFPSSHHEADSFLEDNSISFDEFNKKIKEVL